MSKLVTGKKEGVIGGPGKKEGVIGHSCETIGYRDGPILKVSQTQPVNTLCVFLKPILKWVGGKTQIIDKILAEFPRQITNYHEIFLGGGSVLFALLSCIKHGSIQLTGDIFAYDVNEPLIYVYKNIQSSPIELYDEIHALIQEFHECGDDAIINRKPATIDEAKRAKENYYYWIRREYNNLSAKDKTSIAGSARFIFLNKTCFRGIFRVGPNGFNVPYGHYNNPEIVNREHLLEIHEHIQGVVFTTCDFRVALSSIIQDQETNTNQDQDQDKNQDQDQDQDQDKNQDNDFIYLDPPYAPETATSFVGYTENGFDTGAHRVLFKIMTKFNKKFVMSNSNTEFVREYFPEDRFSIQSIIAKRSINSKNPSAKTTEIIIKPVL